jgi:dipeptidase D
MRHIVTTLSQLTPAPLWRFFAQICSIPHPSKHEAQLVQWIDTWAKSRNLTFKQDQVGNLILSKPATKGMENRAGVILQAHLDMVPQANAATNHDFLTDPIKPRVDGEWLTATDTTLGADNGIGVASILAILESDDIPHGPLEALLTIDEEAGMTGAFGLEGGLLKGSILLNTDTEQEGEIYMGCAGGGDTLVKFAPSGATPTAGQCFELQIKGLKGGHSGCDIHTGRGNANKLMARLLNTLSALESFQLAGINGGTLRNAIPREAGATIIVALSAIDKLKALVSDAEQTMQRELGDIEDKLQVTLVKAPSVECVFAAEMAQRLIAALNACPNGIIRMSQNFQGVVETSLNLGVVKTNEDGSVTAQMLVRSLQDSARSDTEQQLCSLFTLAGAEITQKGGYPGWKPELDSSIMKVIQQTYQDLYQKQPDIMVIHAGLECGLFKNAYPNWDMASIGPTIRFPHSPDEKVNIESVGRYWELLKATLANIPKA